MASRYMLCLACFFITQETNALIGTCLLIQLTSGPGHCTNGVLINAGSAHAVKDLH